MGDGGEVALLRARLEASELRHEVQELRSVVAQYGSRPP